MFFYISNQKQKIFTKQFNLPNGLILNTDDGWKTYNISNKKIIFKGYCNNYCVEDLLPKFLHQSYPTEKGNFCAIISDTSTIKILHDNNRSFPLWCDKNAVTNLHPLKEQIWADCLITINKDLGITKTNFQPYKKIESVQSDENVIDNVHKIISQSFENFLTHNQLPIKIFVTGGLDTVLCWAYLDHFTKNYELVDYEYMKYTTFLKHNTTTLRKLHWGYAQMHSWDYDCVLVSGGNGDENFLRGPTTLSMALKKYNLKLTDILEKTDYHYKYFTSKKIETFDRVKDIDAWILNRNINDHQHWHLDKTLTFTPLKDIEILQTILSASKNLLIAQGKNGEINRRLIQKLDPKKLKHISLQKNLNEMENLL